MQKIARSLLIVVGLLLAPLAIAETMSNNQLTLRVGDLLEAGDYSAARALLDRHADLYQGSALLQTYSGRIYFELRQFKKAEQQLSKLLTTNPDNREAAFLLDKIHRQRAQKKLAIKVSTLLDNGDFNAARSLLDADSEVYADHSLLLTYSGRAYYELRRLDEAENELMVALKLDPENGEAKKFIEEIREYREKTTSQLWAEVIKPVLVDKGFDLLIIVLGFLFAISIKEWVQSWWKQADISDLVEAQAWVELSAYLAREIDARNYPEVLKIAHAIDRGKAGVCLNILVCEEHQRIVAKLQELDGKPPQPQGREHGFDKDTRGAA